MATVVFTCLLSSASVTGTLSLDGMTGSQWANVKDHSLLVIDVHYVWSNEVVVSEDGTTPPDDTGETGDGTTEDGDEAAEAVEGWVASSTLMTLTADSEQHIGYDVAGSITRDTLSGQAGERRKGDAPLY